MKIVLEIQALPSVFPDQSVSKQIVQEYQRVLKSREVPSGGPAGLMKDCKRAVWWRRGCRIRRLLSKRKQARAQPPWPLAINYPLPTSRVVGSYQSYSSEPLRM
jgi:hypothetical protein